MSAGIGRPVVRSEDDRFLRGEGRFTDDLTFPDIVHAVIIRSPHAAAQILEIKDEEALSSKGVLGVYSARNLGDDLGQIPCFGGHRRSDGSSMFIPPHPVLAREKVVFVGEAVVLVVAESLADARMAADLVEVNYLPSKAVTDVELAVEPGAPIVWPDCSDNISFHFSVGDKKAVEQAFSAADHTTTISYRISRVYAAPLEPRAAIGLYDPVERRYTLYSGTQAPHNLRRVIAQHLLRVPEGELRVVSPDMGGAFGMRSSPYPEMVLVLWAARKLGKPVKWRGERSEGFVGDEHARDNVTKVSLALDKNKKFLALRVDTLAALGGYVATGGASPPTVNLGGLAGVYNTPVICADVNGVFTNTPPTAPYRGAGRPEASFAIERVIDVAASELEVDPAELRRNNTIAAESMPYKTGLVFEYDSGDFLGNLEIALDESEYEGFSERRNKSEAAGFLRGFGIANVIERAAAMGEETAEVRVDSSGFITLLVGTHSHGQGHETVFKQVLYESLNITRDQVRFVQGDTDVVAQGFGTFGSRSSGLGGSAVSNAALTILEKAKKIAAHVLEVSAEDVIFKDGTFSVLGTDRHISWKDVAQRAYQPLGIPSDMEPGLNERAVYVPTAPTFPNGCHCAEVEIDCETGRVELLRYTVVDDVGTVLNPLLLKGQIHGGLVQGVGQILMEQVQYDPETGQPVTGSFMDYCMPRAADLPFFSVRSKPVPTTVNPLGVKGAGEAGTVGAMPAVMNAIMNALGPLGIHDLNMPVTAERIWEALRNRSVT